MYLFHLYIMGGVRSDMIYLSIYYITILPLLLLLYPSLPFNNNVVSVDDDILLLCPLLSLPLLPTLDSGVFIGGIVTPHTGFNLVGVDDDSIIPLVRVNDTFLCKEEDIRNTKHNCPP